jgi:hypothetical protein
MSEWKTIDSAPKDGRRILTYAPPAGFNNDGVQVNFWVQKEEHPWGDKWWKSSTINPPSHWMELPEGPE